MPFKLQQGKNLDQIKAEKDYFDYSQYLYLTGPGLELVKTIPFETEEILLCAITQNFSQSGLICYKNQILIKIVEDYLNLIREKVQIELAIGNNNLKNIIAEMKFPLINKREVWGKKNSLEDIVTLVEFQLPEFSENILAFLIKNEDMIKHFNPGQVVSTSKNQNSKFHNSEFYVSASAAKIEKVIESLRNPEVDNLLASRGIPINIKQKGKREIIAKEFNYSDISSFTNNDFFILRDLTDFEKQAKKIKDILDAYGNLYSDLFEILVNEKVLKTIERKVEKMLEKEDQKMAQDLEKLLGFRLEITLKTKKDF